MCQLFQMRFSACMIDDDVTAWELVYVFVLARELNR